MHAPRPQPPRCPLQPIGLLLLVLFIPGFGGGCAHYDALSTAESPGPSTPLAFMVGYWQDESLMQSQGQSGFRAVYSMSERGEVTSYTEFRRDGNVAFYEFERFAWTGSEYTFFPYPGGKPATPMPWASGGPTHAVFEHPTKDFPTRIEYRSPSPDQLVVTLTDPYGESDRVQRFAFRREPKPAKR